MSFKAASITFVEFPLPISIIFVGFFNLKKLNKISASPAPYEPLVIEKLLSVFKSASLSKKD